VRPPFPKSHTSLSVENAKNHRAASPTFQTRNHSLDYPTSKNAGGCAEALTRPADQDVSYLFTSLANAAVPSDLGRAEHLRFAYENLAPGCSVSESRKIPQAKGTIKKTEHLQ
jgi:hypothetical protein